MYRLIQTENSARLGEFTTPHGVVQTPAFHECGNVRRH
jgi:queuine/archaeosine tRNA-ribosyltransferase